jgi:hypothetical protein
MNVKEWFLNLFKKNDIKPGRQSVEPLSVYLPKTKDVISRVINPKYPREALQQIEQAVFTNPILSQVHNLFVNLANTGYTVEIVPENENAKKEIQLFASQQNIDALVNSLITQIILYGTISCEIVLSEKLDGVAKIVRVHPKDIYFEYNEETDEFKPYQILSNNEIRELNPKTYIYIPLLTIDGSPYGIPPMLASLSLINTTNQFTEEISNLAKKLGILGFLDVKFPPLPKAPSETESEYQERLQKFLEETGKSITENLNKGIFLHFEGTEVNFKDISASIGGIKELLSTLEKWTIESAKAQPALLGFSDGYTETWASVSLHIFISQLKNYHNIIERFLEYTYKLHLALKGIFPDDVNVIFANPPSFNAKDEEDAKKTKVEWVLSLLQGGVISVEEARNLLADIL